MADLPVQFVERMKALLPGEWDSFASQADQTRQYGLRVNTLKITTEEFERIAPFHLRKIPWIRDGYYYEREDEPARHPFYAAGLYYLQEPSAMTPASRLRVEPGDRVLDLCAAPGGKATALAAGLQGQGLLVANDINKARARALLRNLELFGVTDSLVLNEAPHILAEHFPEYFDKIMVDAPCSGEGMFRKNPAVMDSWREKGPDYFSALQREIVLHAADMLKPGGMMFYSTCTFAPEENEGVMTHLLKERPDMEIIPMEDYEGFGPGILSFAGETFHEDCRLCRRIWPHRMAGEGHFLALLRKKGEELSDNNLAEGQRKQPGKNQAWNQDRSQGKKQAGSQAWNLDRSQGKNLARNQVRNLDRNQGKSLARHQGKHPGKNQGKAESGPDKEALSSLEGFFSDIHRPDLLSGLDIRGDKVYYVPDRSLSEQRLHFLRYGVYVGDLKKKRFEPAQPLALILKPGDYDRTIDLAGEDERLARYLGGEAIELANADLGNGWVLLTVEGYPLAWGKLAGRLVKNKYPTGWRRRN